ncbi:hypothetical protein GJ496_003006 [Pomphorhynchus laevis]|nr:hypothetical protein GJ496_003006 [Pomphorhynchus laevis]
MPFIDSYYFVCFYVHSYNWKTHTWSDTVCMGNLLAAALLVSLPSWFRFWQCIRRYYDSKLVFPHIYNAGKYATTFLSALCTYLYEKKRASHSKIQNNPYFYFYIISLVIESTYKCVWDIKVDWGLFDGGSHRSLSNRILRPQLIYSPLLLYYLAILHNIVIRYMWLIRVIIDLRQLGSNYSESFAFIAAMLEMLRRHIWNYFRLENEHLNNVGQFRAVRDISILPIKRMDKLWKGLANKARVKNHNSYQNSHDQISI